MVGFIALLGVLASSHARAVHACGRIVQRLAVAPPAAIVARTGCGDFEIDPDGTVRRHRETWAPAWAPGATSSPGPGVYVAHPHRHLVVLRDGRTLWRSRLRHGSDGVVVHGSTIAFSVYARGEPSPSLWMAHVGAPEFLAGANEEPVGWTAAGLVTQHGDEIRVRRADGTVARTLAHAQNAVYDRADGTVVMVTRSGWVVRTDGVHLWKLAKADPHSWVAVLANRMLQVTMRSHDVYVRPDGSRFGETPASVGSVLDLPGERRLLYVVNVGRRGRAPGVNVVYFLRANGTPKRLYAHRVPYLSCGEWAGLSYAHGHVLYADAEGPVAVLDPAGRRPPLDLTRAFRVLQPRRPSSARLSADWLSNWS